MTRPPVVLTVCLGNICRSPTAAAAVREAADAAGIEVEVHSAGTGSWHLGEPPDARMRRAADAAGLTLDGVAQLADAEAIDAADLVLAMDRQNLADLERIAADAGLSTPIRLFRSYDPQVAGVGASPGAGPARDDLEVPDPYYGGADGFAEVVALCRAAAQGVVASLVAQGVPGEPEAR